MKEFIEKLIGRLEEKFKYNSEQAEIWRNGSDKDAYFRAQKDLYMDRANTYGEVMRIVNQLAGEYNNGWIPVEKTLPKKSGYYTVTEEQYSLDMRKKMGVRVSHEVQFDAEEQRWHRAKFLKVIAWKEHETPYQPKGE